MNATFLIDSIVRHTTVLIAQVATTAGLRALLAHVANRVFLDLVTEIERQGVARKVVADMFGLALRSYQQKVQRLSESVTDSGQTLWEAVYGFLQEHEVASREQVLARFSRDDDASVRSILSDLVESGLAEELGGSSYTFDVWPGHPAERRVRSLLAQTRAQISELWNEVSAHNRQHASSATF